MKTRVHDVLYFLHNCRHKNTIWKPILLGTVLFFSCPRSEGWPHHGCTFSIYLCLMSFWLILPRGVLLDGGVVKIGWISLPRG